MQPAYTDTPRNSKRYRTEQGDSDVARMDGLLIKVDQISVVLSKNEANINLLMKEGEKCCHCCSRFGLHRQTL